MTVAAPEIHSYPQILTFSTQARVWSHYRMKYPLIQQHVPPPKFIMEKHPEMFSYYSTHNISYLFSQSSILDLHII